VKHTPLHKWHVQQHALMVDFAGWSMPLHYGSQIEEHHAVRNDAGMFDVSHMGVIDIEGEQSANFLRHLLANDIARLKHPGTALYTCMLNEHGGIIDDLIMYWINASTYRLVVNASTREKDLEWIKKQAIPYDNVNITLYQDLSIIAVQGPNAIQKLVQAFPKLKSSIISLKPFHCLLVEDPPLLISRTGYTGEDGVEIILPNKEALSFWETLITYDVRPIGLGARDTLRLEAGLNLYGQDMDETVTPLESNLSWTVAFEPNERNFIGRRALVAQLKEGVTKQLLGLILQDRGVLRHDQLIFSGEQLLGKITSGSFSPTLNQSIALARLHLPATQPLDFCEVEIRQRHLSVKVVKPPFVKRKFLR
jgi:aminomethyltransferase